MSILAKKIYSLIWSGRLSFLSAMSIKKLGQAGSGCLIYPTARIYNGRFVRLGSNVTINDFVHIWGLGGVSIGDDSMIASHCAIISQTHDVAAYAKGLKYRDTLDASKAVHIGRNVWIGAGSIVLPGVTIGDDSVVAAGAVVTRDVAARTLVAGVPANLIRSLDNQ